MSTSPEAVARGSLDFANLKNPLLQAPYVQSFWGGERLAAAAGILLFIGACGKSAQFPLYVWLPDAMAGPTPVSALIHAATMVTAGVYMVCRLSFLYSASTTALIVVSTIGLITALLAAFYAFAQTDLKKVLAYSTVSQLGYMFVPPAPVTGSSRSFHLTTRVLQGRAVPRRRQRDVRDGTRWLDNARRHHDDGRPAQAAAHAVVFLIYCLAIAGIVPFAGFFSGRDPRRFVGRRAAGLGIWYGKVAVGGPADRRARHTSFYSGGCTSSCSPARSAARLRRRARIAGVDDEAADRPRDPYHRHRVIGPAPAMVLRIAKTSRRSGTRSRRGSRRASREMASRRHRDPRPHVRSVDGRLMGIALAVGARHRARVAVLRPGPDGDGGQDRHRARPGVPGLEGSCGSTRSTTRYRPAVPAARARAVRDRRSIHHRYLVAVNGSAFIVRMFSRMARWYRTARCSATWSDSSSARRQCSAVTDCHRKSTFSRRASAPDRAHADRARHRRETSKLKWDLDGDGKPDVDPKTGEAASIQPTSGPSRRRRC